MEEQKLYSAEARTEEVQDIVDRMPTRFGLVVGLIVLLLFSFLMILGWFIKYPDIIIGQIVVNSNNAPLKLIANENGKLKLNHIASMDNVKEGQLIAYLENSTNFNNVFSIDNLLKIQNPVPDTILKLRTKLPNNISLGELDAQYFTFLNNLQEYNNYQQDKLLEKQSKNLTAMLEEQTNSLKILITRVDMASKTLYYVHRSYSRDSTLFLKRVISESELEKTQMNYLSSRDALQNSSNSLIAVQQQIQQTKGQLQDLSIQKPEKEKQLKVALISSYNDLRDNIKTWKTKYAFIAPFTGKVQFLKFYNENQFIQAGEEIFTIVPKESDAFGQVILPAQGSGKIKVGQEVIVKLDNYPYMEYGTITGRVKSIALTTSPLKTETNIVDSYLVLVSFPNQLKTNYNQKLSFRAEAKGSAEIITKDRRLIERLFDNLNYALKK